MDKSSSTSVPVAVGRGHKKEKANIFCKFDTSTLKLAVTQQEHWVGDLFCMYNQYKY